LSVPEHVDEEARGAAKMLKQPQQFHHSSYKFEIDMASGSNETQALMTFMQL